MKKSIVKEIMIAAIATIVLVSGCSKTVDKRPHKKAEDPITITSMETIKKDYNEDLPEGYIAPNIPAEPQFDDSGDVYVTRVQSGNRKSFLWSEDYEWFSKEGETWTLDLNGNTVVVDETITVSSKLTITNGTLVIKATPGFVTTSNTDEWQLVFSGKEIGDLSIVVSDGATGVYVSGETRFDDVNMDVYGIGVLIDTAMEPASPDGLYSCIFVDSNVNVYSGTGIVNPNNAEVVFSKLKNWSGSGSVMTVYPNALGIDNYGLFGDRSEPYFSEIRVMGGCGIYNHEDASYKQLSGATERVYVEGGMGIMNEGLYETEVKLDIKEGVGFYNKGVASLNECELFTVPTEIYSGTMFYNDVDSRMEFKHILLGCFTASKAKGIENHGIISGGDYGIIRMFGGTPNPYEDYELTLYKNEHEESASFFAGATNIFEKTQLLVNEQGSALSTAEMECYINATDTSQSSWDDTTIGFYNKSSQMVTELSAFVGRIRGDGAIGLVNSEGGYIGAKKDAQNPQLDVMLAEVTDYNLSYEDYLAELRTRTDAPKKCTGIVNMGTLAGYRHVYLHIYGDDCTGFDNQGTITAYSDDESSYSMDLVVRVVGNDNEVLKNHVWEASESQSGDKTGSANIYVFGNGNTILESDKQFGMFEFAAHASGEGNRFMKLSGDTSIYRNNLFLSEDENTDESKNAILLENSGTYNGSELSVNAEYGTGGNTIFMNTTNGYIKLDNRLDVTRAVGCDNKLFTNYGIIWSKKISVSNDRCNDSIVFYNEGGIHSYDFSATIGADGTTGLQGFVNTGSLYEYNSQVEIYRDSCTTDYTQNGQVFINQTWDDNDYRYGTYRLSIYDSAGKTVYSEYNYEDEIRTN